MTRHDRVPTTRLTAIAAAGDLTFVAAFVLIGATVGHGEDPVAQGGQIAATLLTFILGWVLAALATRAYAPDWADRVGTAAGRTALAWLVAVGVALALRSTALVPGTAALSFAMVASAVGLAMLVPWRVGLAWASKR